MKTYFITIAVLFCSCVGYGQDLSPLHFDKKGHVINAPIDTSIYKGKPIILYGLAGIKSEPIDTQKLKYFRKYIYYIKEMDKYTGRKSARYEDSADYYLKLLYPNKK